jgi:hypothetical protein
MSLRYVRRPVLHLNSSATHTPAHESSILRAFQALSTLEVEIKPWPVHSAPEILDSSNCTNALELHWVSQVKSTDKFSRHIREKARDCDANNWQLKMQHHQVTTATAASEDCTPDSHMSAAVTLILQMNAWWLLSFNVRRTEYKEGDHVSLKARKIYNITSSCRSIHVQLKTSRRLITKLWPILISVDSAQLRMSTAFRHSTSWQRTNPW